MFTDLNVFQMAHAMAVHAGRRQAVIANNVANADTPGFRARDLAAFSAHVQSDARPMRSSRDGHVWAPSGAGAPVAERASALSDPEGGAVSIETEMLRAVDAKRQHDRAIAIYRSGLAILRAGLGRQ